MSKSIMKLMCESEKAQRPRGTYIHPSDTLNKEDVEKAIKLLSKALHIYFREENIRNERRRKFLGGKDYYVTHTFSTHLLNVAGITLNDFLKRCKVLKVTNYSGNGRREITPNIETVKLGSKMKTVYTDVTIYLIYEGVKCIIETDLAGYYIIRMLVPNNRKRFVRRMMKEYLTSVEKAHIYKNYTIRAEEWGVEFIDKSKDKIQDLILPSSLMKQIKTNIITPIRELNRGKVPTLSRRGLLFVGIPGTGKTTLCRALANQLKCTFIWISVKAFTRQNRLSEIFELAKRNSPSIICIEDIDFTGKNRNVDKNMELGELLNVLDGANIYDNVYIIATTNNMKLLDDAIIKRPGRFDVILTFPTLTKKNVDSLIKKMVGKTAYRALSKQEGYDDVLDKLANSTGAVVREIITTARIEYGGVSVKNLLASCKLRSYFLNNGEEKKYVG